MFNTDGVPREKELWSIFYPESFQMIANGESKFLAFSLQLPIAGFNLPYSFKKKSRFFEDVWPYLEKEVIAFAKIEMK